LERLARVGISDSTVWRNHREVALQLDEALEREQEIPPHVSQEDMSAMEWVPAQERIETHASVSIDGVRVLVRDDGYREVKMVSVSEVMEQREEGIDPGIMTVTECEGDLTAEEGAVETSREKVKLKRHSYRAILGDKATFVPALKGELARRRVNQADKISTVNDGAEWIWDLVETNLPGRTIEILDWPHAMQNLAKAGNAGWGEGTEQARVWFEQRRAELWDGNLVQVRIGLDELPRRYKERGTAIRQVKEYIDQHWHRMAYRRLRETGRPIGSGTVESAAKNVVSWRMKRGGQRWTREGASRMLAALGEIHSNRWDTRVHRLTKAA
jgi:hypothetical protein